MEEKYVNNFFSHNENKEEDENSYNAKDINEITFYSKAEYEFENI